MKRKAELKYALLLCGEFFRDELMSGVDSPRLAAKFKELCDVCFDALDEPSLADADKIRATSAEATAL